MTQDFGIDARQGGMACLADISSTEELNLAILEAGARYTRASLFIDSHRTHCVQAGLLSLITMHVAAHMDEETQNYAAIALANFLRSGGHEALPDSVEDDVAFQELRVHSPAVAILFADDFEINL